jgi:hypothetical protein
MTHFPSALVASRRGLMLVPLLLATLAACDPTVRVEGPREPITINLNIKADVRVRVEEQAKKDIKANDDIF